MVPCLSREANPTGLSGPHNCISHNFPSDAAAAAATGPGTTRGLRTRTNTTAPHLLLPSAAQSHGCLWVPLVGAGWVSVESRAQAGITGKHCHNSKICGVSCLWVGLGQQAPVCHPSYMTCSPTIHADHLSAVLFKIGHLGCSKEFPQLKAQKFFQKALMSPSLVLMRSKT